MAINQNDVPKSNVCRRLFQDNIESAAVLTLRHELLSYRNLVKAKMKWNFDFKKGIPLDGDWVWKNVEGSKENYTELIEMSNKENSNPNN